MSREQQLTRRGTPNPLPLHADRVWGLVWRGFAAANWGGITDEAFAAAAYRVTKHSKEVLRIVIPARGASGK